VLAFKEQKPTAVLLEAVVLANKEQVPTAVLLEAVLLNKEALPIETFEFPAVLIYQCLVTNCNITSTCRVTLHWRSTNCYVLEILSY
jgi:hypothetical protein